MICTDQGEFFTSVNKEYALPYLLDQYGGEIRPEDQQFFLPANELDFIDMSVRENTLRGLIPLCYYSIRKEKRKNQQKGGDHQGI